MMRRSSSKLDMRRGLIGATALAVGLGCPEPASTQDGGAGTEDSTVAVFEDVGFPVSVEVAYTADLIGVVGGGRERGARYLHNVDLTANLDLDRLGWSGAGLFLYGLANHGGEPSRLAGDAQAIDNIEAPAAWRLYEAWLQQRLAGGHLTLLAGLYDLNAEFDVNDVGALFLHSAHGIGTDVAQSGRNGPSIFPITSLGVRLRALPSTRTYLQAVVLDAVPGDPSDPGRTHVRLSTDEGALVVVEGGVVRGGAARLAVEGRGDGAPLGRLRRRRAGREGAGAYETKLSVGGWAYTSRQPRVATAGAPGPNAISAGAYLLVEGPLVREGPAGQGLWGFGRVGWAAPATNRFAWYTGAGLAYRGPLPGRPDDEAGIAVAAAHNGDPHRKATAAAGGPTTRSETALELSYLANLTSWAAVQLDLQRVWNPDTDPALPPATVLGARFVVEP